MIVHACDVCSTPRTNGRGWLTLHLDSVSPADAQVIDLCSVRCGYAFFVDEMEGQLDEEEAHMEEISEEDFDTAFEAGEKVDVEPRRVQLRPTMSLADFAAQSQTGGGSESEAAVQGSDTFRRQV